MKWRCEMGTPRQRSTWRAFATSIAVVWLWHASVWAGGLGGGIDGFLTTWQTWCIGLGIVLFATGAVCWFGEKMNSTYQPVLSGAMNLIVPGGIFGALLVIAGALGLATGGTLPF